MKVDSNQQGICLSNFANQAAENGVLQAPFSSPRYQTQFSFQYNIHTTLSILILIDYLPAEVYTEISPLSPLSLAHLFILSMSIINTVTLLVAAVTLFQCSCCQVNFLDCHICKDFMRYQKSFYLASSFQLHILRELSYVVSRCFI